MNMRLAIIIAGGLALTGCAEQQNTTDAGAFALDAEQQVLAKVAPDAPEVEGQRVVRLPKADVTIGNVSVFNGAYPVAMTHAREQCIARGLDAVRVSDLTPDGFVQFNCRAFSGPK